MPSPTTPLSYTLDQVKATPEFATLVGMGLVYDSSPIQEAAMTIMFTKNGLRYMVYQNGYVRRGKWHEYTQKYELNPIQYENYTRPERCLTLQAYQTKMQILIDYLIRNKL